MDFVAIDFETANSARTSVCSVGIVVVENGKIQEEIHSLINPLSDFHYMNTRIHGITENMVQDSPTFDEFWPTFKRYMGNQQLIAHNASFDMGVLRASINQIEEEHPEFFYACSYRISKKIWPDLYNHKLSTVSDFLGIPLKHHDALEDARAAAIITMEALKQTQTQSLEELSKLHKIKLHPFVLPTKQATR